MDVEAPAPKAKSKMVTKSFYSLDSPFPAPEWPPISPANGATILELLCSSLSPIGEHRSRHKTPSKGKRSKKRKRKAEETEAKPNESVATPQAPELTKHITVGFNSTVRCLQESINGAPQTMLGTKLVCDKEATPPLSAVFVDRSSVPALLWEKLPFLIHSLMKRESGDIRLVALPRDSESRLSIALGIPRAGIVGVSRDAPGATELLQFTATNVGVVSIPWMADLLAGKYLSATFQVKTVESTVKQNPRALKDTSKESQK